MKIQWYWCDYEQAPCTMSGGICSDCGSTDHLTLEDAQEEERRENDACSCGHEQCGAC